MPEETSPADKAREIHLSALDDLTAVNSLFTLAVFVGLAFANPGNPSLENRKDCIANVGTAKRLVVLEVICFSCLLFSSLVAKAVKLHIYVHKNDESKDDVKLTRWTLLNLSGWASVLGYVFLAGSLLDLVQVRLGKPSCGGKHTIGATVSLALIVASALCIYTGFMAKAITESIKPHPEIAAPTATSRKQTQA